ncbi:hypothetical protein MKX03_017453, partial [Papaver bracteatum]
GNMKTQTGSSVGDHYVPVKKTKVSKPPSMPPPKVLVSKAAKKFKVIKSVVPDEVEIVASESSDSGDFDDSVHREAATTDVVPPVTRKRKRTSKAWDEYEEVLVNGKVTHGKYKHYKNKITTKSTHGTSSLRKHLKCCHVYKGTQQ